MPYCILLVPTLCTCIFGLDAVVIAVGTVGTIFYCGKRPYNRSFVIPLFGTSDASRSSVIHGYRLPISPLTSYKFKQLSRLTAFEFRQAILNGGGLFSVMATAPPCNSQARVSRIFHSQCPDTHIYTFDPRSKFVPASFCPVRLLFSPSFLRGTALLRGADT